MNIQVLIENTSPSDLISEHGLSIFIEYKGKKILLDAGTTSAFMDNAKKLNVDIADADFCVLSHGHYDHSGGFAKYFEEYPDKKVYAMRTSIEEYYSGSGDFIHKIGIPDNVYPQYSSNFIFVNKPTEISEGVYLIPHSASKLEEIGKRAKLYKKVDGKYAPDDFSHEMSLVFDTDNGLVVFNSCSHGGVINIIEEVKAYLGDKSIYAFVGGLHMKGKVGETEVCTFSEDEISKMTEYLRNNGIKKLYTGHCTGIVGYELIKKYMGEDVKYISTGRKLEILIKPLTN